MKREFIINIILLVFINILVKPIYIFGVDARIQNLVGTETYGLYFDYFNFVFLFQFLNDPGIQNWNAQFVPKNRENIGFHLPLIIQIKIVLAFIFIVILVISSMFIGYDNQKMMVLLGISMILSTFFMLLRGTISGLGYYRTDSLLSILDKSLMIVILGYLAWFSKYQYQFDISYLIYGQVLAYGISCIVALIILKSKFKWVIEKLTLDYFMKVIKWSSPYVLILLFMTAYNKLDGVMLGRMLNDNNYQAGVYATAYRFYDAANMIGYLFAALLLPMFAANISNLQVLKELKDIGLKYSIFSATIIVLSIFLYGDKMLMMLFDDYNQSFFTVLKILIFSYMMVAVAYIYGTLLVAGGKVRKLNYLFGFGLIINIILNLVLIPKHQAIGAAIATIFTQLLVLIGQILIVRSEWKFITKPTDFVRLILFCLACLVVFYFGKQVSSIEWYFMLGFSILICVLLSFILKVIDKRELIGLFKKKIQS